MSDEVIGPSPEEMGTETHAGEIDPAAVVEANRDFASKNAIALNSSGNDVDLWCDKVEGDKLTRWPCREGINVMLGSDLRIKGLEIQDAENQAFKNLPPLKDIWNQYKAASSNEDKAEASLRLFHAGLSTALPEISDEIMKLYPEK